MMDVISIIVPIFNAEKYLVRCLDSILNQDYKHWECILVNDGSSDKSGSICDNYSEYDSRIRVIHQTNQGVSSARNVGLSASKGDWICFVDSDDILLSYALSHMLELNKRYMADVCLCTITRDNEPVCETKILNKTEKKHLIYASLAYRTEKYVTKGFLIDAPHAKLFRSAIIINNGIKFVDGLSKSEDALFDAQFYHHSACIVMDTRPVYTYTINQGSICRTYKFQNILMFDILLRHESEMIQKWYSEDSMFKYLLNIRTFVALEQVMYETGAERLSYFDRIKAMRLFMSSKFLSSIILKTKYSQIATGVVEKSKRIDLAIIKKRMFLLMCLWIDFRKFMLRMRVSIVKDIKKLFNIDQTKSLSSIFNK